MKWADISVCKLNSPLQSMYNLLWETGHPEQTLLKSSLSLPMLITFGISPSVPHCSLPWEGDGNVAGREKSRGKLWSFVHRAW